MTDKLWSKKQELVAILVMVIGIGIVTLVMWITG